MVQADFIEHLEEVFAVRTLFLSSLDRNEVLAYTVGSLELQRSLFDPGTGDYKSSLARHIDDHVYFYVDQQELELPEPALAKLVALETDLCIPTLRQLRKSD